MRRIAAALLLPLIAALALVGCGSSSTPPSSPNQSVTAAGTFGKAPNVKIPAKKAGKDLYVKTEIQGSGATLTKSDAFLTNYVVYIWSGTTHKLVLSTYSSTPQVLSGSLLPGLQTALQGKKMGSRVLAVLPPKYGYGSSGNTEVGVTGSDTLVFVVDMIKSYSGTASAAGTHVSNGGGSLPTVSQATGKAPTVTIPKTSPPSGLIVKTLIKGNGPPITKGQEVVTQYVGLNWRTRAVFDSSWSRGAPFGFQIDASPAQIIPGWDTGLLGVPVGSRVMLIIPPKDGYGSSGESSAGIKGTDTLVFVVDVLDAVNSGKS
ncbi:MAG TPA: FKBP-type peptidyl-prolyl cis-trans isomerase [Streptosporangiaceae bacterium]|nr:FKBP-type peptidyl-prolyl cis-trans isomerase [Streptosporangiaceae bacterium]